MTNKPHDGGQSSALMYWAALLLVVFPLLSLATAWPPAPASAGWRFAAVGLLAGALLLPTVGLVAAALLARALGHRVALAAIGVAAGTAALLLTVVGIGFALDAIQLHGLVGPARLARFDRDVAMAAIQLTLTATTGAMVSVTSLRAVHRSRPLARRQRTAPVPPPVVGVTARSAPQPPFQQPQPQQQP